MENHEDMHYGAYQARSDAAETKAVMKHRRVVLKKIKAAAKRQKTELNYEVGRTDKDTVDSLAAFLRQAGYNVYIVENEKNSKKTMNIDWKRPKD